MNSKNWEYVEARGSITKANADREWMELGVPVSLVALPEETKEEETKEEEMKEEKTKEEETKGEMEEEAVSVSRREETICLVVPGQ